MVACITGVTRHLEIAARAAESVLSSPAAVPAFKMWTRVGLGLMAVLGEEARAAGEQYEALRTVRMGEWYGIMCSDRLLGLLAHTMGDLDRSRQHFEDALAFCHRAGYRPELAWTCHDYGESLLQRNGAGDRARAVSLLNESLTISAELGMRPLMARVEALLQGLGTHPASAPAETFPDGLTRREVEVLRLVAAGNSNQEIAEKLFITARTAGYHVGNILNKTGAANRTEAATYASRNGLA